MTLWYPYTQMKDVASFPVVKSGKGTILFLENGHKLIDGISSWWSTIHGYNHPELNQVLLEQANNISHVMLGGLSHRPAIQLADKLVKITPEGLNHVFFSDSGSVAVEVALKMAFQYWSNKNFSEKNKILSLNNGYHGDTFKAMEVSDDSDFTTAFSGILNRGYFLNTPRGGFFADAKTIATDVDLLEELLKKHHQCIAAFILEPIVQCAGGFRIYSPLYLKTARDLCDKYKVLLIFDEVATGFGRTGKLFASEYAGVTPDIMILGKALTAGYIGHAATIASSKVFDSFLDEGYKKAFMHGPTFMGNPLACAIALRSIELFERENYLMKIKNIELIIEAEFSSIQSAFIKEKKILGAMGVIEVYDKKYLEGFQTLAYANGVWLRPIGNVVYLMPPYIIQENELRKILGIIKKWFNKND
jgi:adenosylmethionine---8-amino-7-oxononanoate aminotransferase